MRGPSFFSFFGLSTISLFGEKHRINTLHLLIVIVFHISAILFYVPLGAFAGMEGSRRGAPPGMRNRLSRIWIEREYNTLLQYFSAYLFYFIYYF